ncbi:MAG TPA: DNA mismatch repair protein MutS [Spirochaetia bacterium]|nr:DNA mismatch repair protein MutS [Spirochaetia bacterium]
MADDSPMMRQYARIKRDHRDAILFFRLGDFYEMFDSDAHEASRILGLTLTQRAGAPMCGIPYHAAHSYVGRLLRAGKKIAICEQIKLRSGVPSAEKLAEREVIEIITPGTATEEDYLDTTANNYLLTLGPVESHERGSVAFAWADLSTGEFAAMSVPAARHAEVIRRLLARLRPREVLVAESLVDGDPEIGSIILEQNDLVVNRFPDWSFDTETGSIRLKELLGVANLKGFGLTDLSPHLAPCGVLIQYIEDTAKSLLPHIRSIHIEHEDDSVGIDDSTQKNLELIQNLNDGAKKFTLLSVLDQTKSAMGARALRRWILSPLKDLSSIAERQSVVETLYHDQLRLGELRIMLGGILDLERLSARVAMDKAHGKDLAAIGSTLEHVSRIEMLMRDSSVPVKLPTDLSEEERLRLQSIQELLARAIAENPSVVLTEGNLIRPGFDEKLDELKELRSNSEAVLEQYLQEERDRSGIQNLRIRYNKIIGHYIEVSKGNLKSVPEHFIRRQTLVGGDRFTTERLGEIESKLNNASELIIDTERELFIDLRNRAKGELSALLSASKRIASLDCLQSFAYCATLHGYTKPTVVASSLLSIRAGRHPVVEAHAPAGSFVPNDIELSAEVDEKSPGSFALITGPNMAGKSTYLRQTALITLMAQIGSFVPAQEAVIGLVDRIFCRVGASDNLARGESTFLVEMNETAHILHSATPSSLVIMDEVGRGTGTNDGLAIAWAVSEHLLDAVGCRTLFATHYHELTALAHKGLFNLSLSVQEHGNEIVFLKRVEKGPSSNSYGIHVARLAGLPHSVVRRANELLLELQASREGGGAHFVPAPASPKDDGQPGLFSGDELVIQDLLSFDVTRTTPLEALNRIERWQKELRG